MTRKIPSLAAIALLVFGCGRSGKMQRDQKQYDVVPEGSASGVTSTINGPGETPAPLTDTNADTTTNFTLTTNPNPPGDTAGTATTGSAPATPAWIPASRSPRPHVVTPPAHELRPEPATDTTMTTDTDTAPVPTTTTTDQQRSPKTTTSPEPKKGEEPPSPPPPPTDTTGTRGQKA